MRFRDRKKIDRKKWIEKVEKGECVRTGKGIEERRKGIHRKKRRRKQSRQ